jgi:hypothetical protein
VARLFDHHQQQQATAQLYNTVTRCVLLPCRFMQSATPTTAYQKSACST